jgi:hypothetical protein
MAAGSWKIGIRGPPLADSSVPSPRKSLASGMRVSWLFPALLAEHSKHMFQPKHIAAVLIAMCLASFSEAATQLEPPGAAEKVTIQPRGHAYLFRGLSA